MTTFELKGQADLQTLRLHELLSGPNGIKINANTYLSFVISSKFFAAQNGIRL